MTLIPSTHIPLQGGEPVRLEVSLVGDCQDMPLTYVALSRVMSPEEIAEAADGLRRKVEAFGALIDQEVPEELTMLLDSLEGDSEHEHKAVIGDAFEICWN